MYTYKNPGYTCDLWLGANVNNLLVTSDNFSQEHNLSKLHTDGQATILKYMCT
jgi:hypothetical protein